MLVLSPARSAEARALLQSLVDANASLPAAIRKQRDVKLRLHRGDLSGQRAVRLAAVAKRLHVRPGRARIADVLHAAETYFALAAQLLPLTALERHPAGMLARFSAMPDASFHDTLGAVLSGELAEQRGICGMRDALHPRDVGLLLDPTHTPALRAWLRALADAFASRGTPCSDGDPDPFGSLHQRLVHADVLHVAGEFYTPRWLADIMLEDVGWNPDQRLIDPFGGSGVFASAAIALARRRGARVTDALTSIRLLDINPIACLAAKANLVLALASELRKSTTETILPVSCTDALASAVTGAPSQFPSFDVVATNPPWVGWEYMSRPYRRATAPAWRTFGLFTARGRDAAFVKEDLSTLAFVAACDSFLRDGGHCIAVLRASAMTSTLASKGLRRLSIRPDAGPLELLHVRTFDGLRVFPSASVEAATWMVRKGTPTRFPVPATRMTRIAPGWQPGTRDDLPSVRTHTTEEPAAVDRADPHDAASRWVVGTARCVAHARALEGTTPYRARTGVFTGGANAVFYVERLADGDTPGVGEYRNVTTLAKRHAPSVRAAIEDALVYEVVRGRDLVRWNVTGHATMLCPHTETTRMSPLAPETMVERYPNAMAYLTRMRSVLEARRGFSGWEKAIQARSFHALQRIGNYTFAPFKVAWRYIAKEFVVAVIGPDATGRPRLPNDKVVFVGLHNADEAYYLCALLSSTPVRWKVLAFASSTQRSTNVIAQLRIPAFDPREEDHRALTDACRRGHESPRTVDDGLCVIDDIAARVFGLTSSALRELRGDLERVTSQRGA